MPRILVVEDEDGLRNSLQLELTRLGHECQSVESGNQFLRAIGEFSPDVAVIDLRLPDLDGLDLVRSIRADGVEIPIIVITAYASIPSAVAAMKEGATEYLEKPFDLDQLALVIERSLETSRLRGRLEAYERAASSQAGQVEIVGESEAIKRVLEMAERAASPGLERAGEMPTVLLLGETGTGKDLVAQYIHARGPLASQPFVRVNCTAMPRELIETELFGHEKGAFTDAKTAKKGLLEVASGGTVFLDEIGDMPVGLQSKLLVGIERKCFRRVGGTRDHKMDARIIAATNADLPAMVASGQFRADLYYRLKVFTIEVPPLRDREDDVVVLAKHFVSIYRRKYRKPSVQLTDEARDFIRRYHWPGNVRELAHVLERAMLLTDGGMILPEHVALPQAVMGSARSSGTETPIGEFTKDGHKLEDLEREMVLRAVADADGNVSQAAKRLGLSRGALRRRLAKFGVTPGRPAVG